MSVSNLRYQIETAMKRITNGVEASLNVAQMQKIGEFACTIIARRTRLGGSVKEEGAGRGRLQPLSGEYVDFRKEYKKALSPLTSPGRSNLTMTGQMIDSLKVVRAYLKKVTIGPTGDRMPLSKIVGAVNRQIGREDREAGRKRGRKLMRDMKAGRSKEPTNAEVGAYVSVRRPWLHLSDLEILQVRRYWRKLFGDLKGRF